MKKSVIWVIAALVLIVMGALVVFLANPQSRVYAEEDAMGTIEIGVGDTFIIKLKENPSTGFSWHYVVEPETAINLDSDEYAEDASGNLVGAPGQHEFVFKAVESGTARVTFEYYRDWEVENVEETYLFNFVIR